MTYVKNWRSIFNSPYLTVFFVNIIEPFIPSPDFVFLLNAPENVLLNRISQKKVIEIDETPEKLRLMMKAYQEIRYSYKISRLSKTIWIDIDSNKKPAELASEIYKVIKDILNDRMKNMFEANS